MARASELCMLMKSDVVFQVDGSVQIRFVRTKTKKQGRTVIIRPSGRSTCPVRLLKAWLEFSSEPILFPISSGYPMSSSDITEVLQQIAKEFKSKGRFSSHSLRIGGASALAFAGYTKEQIQAIGDWSSNAIDRYFKETIDHRLNVTSDMLL